MHAPHPRTLGNTPAHPVRTSSARDAPSERESVEQPKRTRHEAVAVNAASEPPWWRSNDVMFMGHSSACGSPGEAYAQYKDRVYRAWRGPVPNAKHAKPPRDRFKNALGYRRGYQLRVPGRTRTGAGSVVPFRHQVSSRMSPRIPSGPSTPDFRRRAGANDRAARHAHSQRLLHVVDAARRRSPIHRSTSPVAPGDLCRLQRHAHRARLKLATPSHSRMRGLSHTTHSRSSSLSAAH
jgi:hypothetical protein